MLKQKIKLVITIETIAREFDYKFFIAREIAKCGYDVHIVLCDYFKLVLMNKSKGYVLLDKVLLDYKINDIRKGILYNLKRKYVKLIYLNEEAAVLKNHDDIERLEFELKSMYDISVFGKDNIVLSAGSFQHGLALRENPTCELLPLGIPRFSLYSDPYKFIYKFMVESVLYQYGDFILINTNFSLFNPATGIEDVFTLHNPENNISISDTTRDISLSFVNEGRQVFAFVELLLEIASKYPDLNFVIRPHPSEDPNYYELFFIGQKNIFINNKGCVNELLLATKALIHNGCTTAIEAYLAGVPVFNYNVISDSKYICTYPNEFGKSMNNLKEFLFEFDMFVTNIRTNKDIEYITNAGNPDFLFNIENNNKVLENYVNLILRVLQNHSIKYTSRIKFSFLGFFKFFVFIPLIHNFNIYILGKNKLGKYFNLKRKFPGFRSKVFDNRHLKLHFDQNSELKVNVLNNFHLIVKK
jgi:surface carbohydrate biosynthesis protein